MSLGSLRSEVSRLESKLHEVEAINRELRSELAIVANGASGADNTLERFNSHIRDTLQSSDDMLHSSHQRVIDSIEMQGEIEKLYVRYKNIELANKKIRAANNKKYYDFVNYRTVRKIVQGIMDNLDVNMVSDKTIAKSVEVQHLQVPDYWLTCVLISIMAWKNDDKELADRATARAISLDKKHSAVFYMLFNLRMQRDDSALKWFGVYQQCEQTGGDQRTFLMLFSLISKTVTDSVDESTRNLVSEYINSVILASAQAEGYSEQDIVGAIIRNYTRLRMAEQTEYRLLHKYCTMYNDLISNIQLAKNNINILEFILKVVNVPDEQRNQFLKDYINELIDMPNQVEQEVYDEIDYNERVIKWEGDVESAKKEFEAEQTRAKNQINLISEMVRWIFDRENDEINGQIRLNMFTLTKGLQEKAVDEYTANYRARRKSVLPIKINDYAADANFSDESGEVAKINSFYTKKRDDGLAAISNLKAFISFGAAAAAFVAAFFWGYWLFMLTAAGLGFGVFVLLMNKSLRKQLELTCRNSIHTASGVISALFAEFKQYQSEFDEYDAYNSRIIDELHKL